MSARILLTCAGGTMAPDLCTHLRSDTVLQAYLVGVDASPGASRLGYVDASYQVPLGDDPTYIDEVTRIIVREKLNLVLPGSDPEAFSLSAAQDRIVAAGAIVMASPVAVLDLIRDKWATYRALEKAGLRVPEYVCVNNLNDLSAALREYGYPHRSVIVKPINGRGGRGMRVLVGKDERPPAWVGAGHRESRHECQPAIEDMEKWVTDILMVMPLLKAPAYDVDVLATQGHADAVIVRRRNNPAGIPYTGNLILSDPSIVGYCRDIAECLGLDALHDMDLMTDDHGKPCLLEVNPRPSGSVVAAHAAGYPIVAAAIAQKLGRDYPLVPPRRDIEVIVMPRAVALA